MKSLQVMALVKIMVSSQAIEFGPWMHLSVSPTSVSVSVLCLCFYVDYNEIYGIMKKFAGLRRNLQDYEEIHMNICLFLFFPHFKSFLC